MNNLSDFQISETINDLKEIQKSIDNTEEQYKEMKKCINQWFLYPSNDSKNLIKIIEDFLKFLEDKKKLNNNGYLNYYKPLQEKFDVYYKNVNKICKNKFIENISGLNEKMKNIIDTLSQFDPPNDNNEINYELEGDLSMLYQNDKTRINQLEDFYCEDDTKSNSKEKESILKCKSCFMEKGFYYCNHCHKTYCKDCGDRIVENQENNSGTSDKHVLEEITLAKENIVKEREKFVKSYLNVLKILTFKVNYILRNKNVFYVDKDSYKKFQYPSINGKNNFKNIIDFFEQINNVEKFIKEKIDIYNEIDNSEICQSLKQNIHKTFNIYKNEFLNDSSDEESVEDENYKIDQEETKEFDDNYEVIKNNFMYIVHLINKKSKDYISTKFTEKIIEKIIKGLDIDKNNLLLSCNNITSFTNKFIKTKSFSKLSPQKIREQFPGFRKLYEYKLLIDGFIRKNCRIKEDKINYEHNFIIPNLTLSIERNDEIYNAPYGWWGVALNISANNNDNTWLNKDSKEWVICYYDFDFGKHFSTEKICDILNNIIVNKILPDYNSNIKSSYNDIRNIGKKVGVGHYLTPYIDIAEKQCGIISFNNKRYKIVLMAKVLKSKIKEPDDRSFWIILDKNDIRIYRILFKEVIYKRRKNH